MEQVRIFRIPSNGLYPQQIMAMLQPKHICIDLHNAYHHNYCAFNGYGQPESKDDAFKLYYFCCSLMYFRFSESSTTDSDAMNMLGYCYLYVS